MSEDDTSASSQSADLVEDLAAFRLETERRLEAVQALRNQIQSERARDQVGEPEVSLPPRRRWRRS